LDQNPEYRGFCNKRENVLFAAHLKKYDAKMNPCRRTLILTPKRILLLGYEAVKTEKQKTTEQKAELVCKWKIDIADLERVHVSTMQDGFFMIQDTWHGREKPPGERLHGKKDPARADLLFKTEYLTEFLYLLSKKTIGYRSYLNFVDEWVMMTPKPKGFLSRFKKLPRDLVFKQLANSNKNGVEVRKVAKYKYEIQVPQGLPKNTQPKVEENSGTLGFAQNIGQSDAKNNQININLSQTNDDLYTLPISKQPEESAYLPPIPTNRSMLRTNSYKPNTEENARKASKRWQESSNVINQAMMGGLVKQLESQQLGNVEKKKNPAPPPRPRTKPKTNLKKCKALWDYDPVDQGELKMRIGDIIVIKNETEEDGWWEGTLNGETGLFPGNFVEKI